MKCIFKSGYWILVVLAALFVLPGVAAIWCYTHPQLLASNLINKGALLKEPIKIKDLGTSGAWQLVYVPQGPAESSLPALEQLAKVRLSLGRHLYGLSLSLAIPPLQPEPTATMKARLKEMDVDVISLQSLPKQLIPNQVWVVNPAGLVVVAYKDESHPKDIFSDLHQLARLWEK